jgi:hypothetical protein
VKHWRSVFFAFIFLLSTAGWTQAPVELTVKMSPHGYAIPADFVGLGFETKSVAPNTYGVNGYFFSPENKQLITLFRNTGINQIRVGGGTVNGSGKNEHCVMPTPDHAAIDQLFAFARAAGVKVIYSVRIENLPACANPHLAEDDAEIVRYIWDNYRDLVDSFSIGNEPDVREFHTYPGQQLDPLVYEATPGIAGSAYASYLADWRHFVEVIHKAVPEATFSGPDTAVSDKSSFTPDRQRGVSWTVAFARDLKPTGLLVEALQHHYVWGGPQNTTAQEAIDDMLSPRWDNDTQKGMQPAYNGGHAEFHPYPYVYETVLKPLAAMGVPYRMTEANDCLHGVTGASDGFASALWALDYMHWWAAHGMAGVNFHNNPWIPTDTIVPDPNPCGPGGCGNYRVSPKAYGMKAFSLGSHGRVQDVTIANPQKINLTAYAVGTPADLYVTVINRTHSTTHDITDAAVMINAPAFPRAQAESMLLTDGEPGNAALSSATLGGDTIRDTGTWNGKWTPLGQVRDGKLRLTVQSTTAVIVRIHENAAAQARM